MNAHENGIAGGIGDLGAHVQRHEVIAFASHDHAQSFALQKPAQLPRHVQGKIFFTPITADCAFVMTSVSRIQDDSLNIANVRHAMRANQRLNGFGYIGTRHKKFSVLLD